MNRRIAVTLTLLLSSHALSIAQSQYTVTRWFVGPPKRSWWVSEVRKVLGGCAEGSALYRFQLDPSVRQGKKVEPSGKVLHRSCEEGNWRDLEVDWRLIQTKEGNWRLDLGGQLYRIKHTAKSKGNREKMVLSTIPTKRIEPVKQIHLLASE